MAIERKRPRRAAPPTGQRWLEEDPIVEGETGGECLVRWPRGNVISYLSNEQRQRLVSDLIIAGVPADA